MRILVYEYASGGGLAGRRVPASLVREGAAMRQALVEDLARDGAHEIVTTIDRRMDGCTCGAEVAALPPGDRARAAALDALIDRVDAVWPIAPETDGCLERLASRIVHRGAFLIASPPDAIDRAADKQRLPTLLAAAGVSHPTTHAVTRRASAVRAANRMGYPIVVKPARGAGSSGVGLARSVRELLPALARARAAARTGRVLLQPRIDGLAASVSLLANGDDALPLAVNTQVFDRSTPFAYRGGVTPIRHPLAARACMTAVAACRAVGGLRGFVGVDVILTSADVVVVEINPRLTTAYLGVRAAFDANVASLALAACAGRLPAQPLRAARRVRFSASGEVRVDDDVRAAAAQAPRPAFGISSPEGPRDRSASVV